MITFCWLVVSPLFAADAPVGTEEAASEMTVAEYHQLSDQLKKLANRQAWSGAARKFDELQALGLPLKYDQWLTGAMAARYLGDTQAAYERLTQAAKLDGTHEVVDWLWTLDTTFGRVSLFTDAKKPELTVAIMPLMPDQRASVERAQAAVLETGTFRGMLPAGEYTLSGHTFEVQPGPHAVVVGVTRVEIIERRVTVADPGD